MLSIQHVLCGALYFDEDTMKRQMSAMVFPDAIRAYSGPRQYSHFEFNETHTASSYWKMPADMSAVTKESVQKSLKVDGHLLSDIRPCVLGEETNIQAFSQMNQHLPEDMFKGVETHLRQDMVFDEFVRQQIDCRDKYHDVFIHGGRLMNGKEVRGVIYDMEQYGVYALAHDLYEQKGITANQQWFEEQIKPDLENAYFAELAEKTFAFMKIDPMIDAYITCHDWSHLNEGPVTYEKYQDLYQCVEEAMVQPSSYSGTGERRRLQVEALSQKLGLDKESEMDDLDMYFWC